MISYFFRRKHSKMSNKTKDVNVVEQNVNHSDKMNASIAEKLFFNQKIAKKIIADYQLSHLNYQTYSTSRKII